MHKKMVLAAILIFVFMTCINGANAQQSKQTKQTKQSQAKIAEPPPVLYNGQNFPSDSQIINSVQRLYGKYEGAAQYHRIVGKYKNYDGAYHVFAEATLSGSKPYYKELLVVRLDTGYWVVGWPGGTYLPVVQ